MKEMIVACFARELHFWRVSNFMYIKPGYDVFIEEIRHQRHGQVKHVVHGQHRLDEVVLAKSKVVWSRVHLEAMIFKLNAVSIERRPQQILPFRTFKFATASFEIVDRVT